MLSLSNAFNREDLINFQKKNINFLALDKNYEIVKKINDEKVNLIFNRNINLITNYGNDKFNTLINRSLNKMISRKFIYNNQNIIYYTTINKSGT